MKIFTTSITKKIAVLMFWVVVWQALYLGVNKEILLVSPFSVLKRLLELMATMDFWTTTLESILSITLGIVIGVILGIVLGIATYYSNILNSLLYPIISIIRATPVASFIILALVWIKTAYVPMFIVILMVLPILWANVYEGMTETDNKLLDMARVFGFSKLKTLFNIYIPSALPYIIAGATTAIGLGWKAGIAAQVIANVGSTIGGELHFAKIYIETVDLFAWTVVVIIISMIFEKILKLMVRRCGNAIKKHK